MTDKPTSPSSFIDALFERERGMIDDLSQHQKRAWQHARFYVLTDIASQGTSMDVPSKPSASEGAARLIAAIKGIPSFILSLPLLRRADVAFGIHERTRNGDDQYVGDAAAVLNKQLSTGRQIVFLCDSRSSYSNDRRYISLEPILALSKLISLVTARFTMILGSWHSSAYRKIIGDSISYRKTDLQRFIQRTHEKEVLTWLLARMLSPRLQTLVLSVSYCKTELIGACRRASTGSARVVEFQHGLISDYHIGYSGVVADSSLLPDNLALLGQGWSDFMNADALGALTVGNNHLSGRAPGWLLVGESGTRILIVSQRTISKQLSTIVSSSLEQNEDLTFAIKLHPSEYSDHAYKNLEGNARVQIIRDASEIKQAIVVDYVAGVYSTLLLELLSAGISVNVIDLPGHEKLPTGGDMNLVPRGPLAATNLRRASVPPQLRQSYFEAFNEQEFLKVIENNYR